MNIHVKRITNKRRKLLAVFNENPGEELSMEDIALKLDCSIHAAYAIVQRLKPHLELVRVVRMTPESKSAARAAKGKS